MSEGLSIVYVEDDEALARLTTAYLSSHGVTVLWLARGELAVREVLRSRPDVVLLDVMLPDGDGFDICRQLRGCVDIPIIMVTGRVDGASRVLGLEGGADDYVSKPFSPRELLARVRAHARRARGKVGPVPKRWEVGTLVVNAGTRTATLGGKALLLTTYEFDLLRVLAEHAGKVLGRVELLQLVQDSPDEVFDRSIDVRVSRLRHKLESDPSHPRLLKTVRGVGYMLTPNGG